MAIVVDLVEGDLRHPHRSRAMMEGDVADGGDWSIRAWLETTQRITRLLEEMAESDLSASQIRPTS